VSEQDIFDHRGHKFRVLDTEPQPSSIKAGDWVRICYDPYSSKPDIVACVMSCRPIWPLNPNARPGEPAFLPDDHLLELARDGDHADVFQQLFSHEYIELVGRVDDESAALGNGRARGMNIVVCLDGTWNGNDLENTNVHRILGLLDKRKCISNYYSGVGVGSRRLGYLLDGLTGRGVFRTVRLAYTFVKANYMEGDRIYIFGFSRGAFAARHLAGLIAHCGLAWHPEATYNSYRSILRNKTAPGGRGVDVDFLGMFDCVPGNQIYMLRDAPTELNATTIEHRIRNVAHAVSRDEHRSPFKPLVFAPDRQASFEQRWFPGYHSDIGGDMNEDLNNFSLAWMLVQACRCGLSLSGLVPTAFEPAAPGKRIDDLTTRMGISCARSELPEAKFIEREPSADTLRNEISQLTRLQTRSP
jgi:hypothetical protein